MGRTRSHRPARRADRRTRAERLGQDDVAAGDPGAGAALRRHDLGARRTSPLAGRRRVGYLPQSRPLPPDTALRGRDLVTLGVSGHRFGLPIPRRGDAARVDALIDAVGAREFADRPVGELSGGEQQRLRAGQALADEPGLLLCDEPLTSLDLANQQAVIGLIDRHRREKDAAVLLVTHDINPVLGKVDRILYLANGRFTLGTPDEVLNSRVLTDLYGAPVFVLRAGDRLVVVGAPDAEASHHHHAHDEDHA
nr:metal ABC transporter ATP-binding protein [Microbacterium flavescens]